MGAFWRCVKTPILTLMKALVMESMLLGLQVESIQDKAALMQLNVNLAELTLRVICQARYLQVRGIELFHRRRRKSKQWPTNYSSILFTIPFLMRKMSPELSLYLKLHTRKSLKIQNHCLQRKFRTIWTNLDLCCVNLEFDSIHFLETLKIYLFKDKTRKLCRYFSSGNKWWYSLSTKNNSSEINCTQSNHRSSVTKNILLTLIIIKIRLEHRMRRKHFFKSKSANLVLKRKQNLSFWRHLCWALKTCLRKYKIASSKKHSSSGSTISPSARSLKLHLPGC